MTTKKLKKTQGKYSCEKCDFYSNNKNDYNRHLQTKKHNTTITTKLQPKSTHPCICGKIYNHRASLYNHKQRCTVAKNETTQSQPEMSKNEPSMTEMFMQLMEKNQELQDQLLEIAKEPKTVINQNSFNLNNFLNVQCRDAMNLSEFIENIPVNFKDDDTNLDNNSKIIIEMCNYNKKNADSIHKKLLKYISDSTPIVK
jgi:type I site-specific restriction endonuclease